MITSTSSTQNMKYVRDGTDGPHTAEVNHPQRTRSGRTPEGGTLAGNSTPLRRRPVQQRSTQRVERMLEACAALIDEVGYDGVTTTLIAERAGVAVGSLYQFFPDKRAVVQALTARNLESFMATISERMTGAELSHWWDAVDMVFDAYAQMYREVPGFTQIRFGDVVDLRLLDDQRDNNTVIADGLAGLLAERFQLRLTDLRLPVSVAGEIADGILNLAFRRRLFDEPTMIAEAKRVVHSYLSGYLDEHPDGNPGRPAQPNDLPSPR
jgi:AcrR family transcriptional regulator